MPLRHVWFVYGALPTAVGAPIPCLATYGTIWGWPSASEWIPPGQGAWWEDRVANVKRHKQLYRHDPANGVVGDCERATLACLLGFNDVEDVPHFMVNERGEKELEGRFWDKVNAWLAQQGYKRFVVAFPGDIPLKDVMLTMGVQNPGIYWRLTGTSRNGCNHVVICFGNGIWHDTSLDNSGIVGPADDGYWWVEVLLPLRFTEFQQREGIAGLTPLPTNQLELS